jgi:nucleotidyltransferase/DNA polymerase involved in DNA repair
MFATLYLPNFYLQAAVRHCPEVADTPVALIDDQAAKAVIIQLNSAAEAAGIYAEMTPSQGLARCLQLVVKTRVRTQEKAIEQIVLQLAYSLSPFIEATGPGLCTIEFTDVKQIDARVLAVIEQLAPLQIYAQAGIAHTADASLLVAHLARPVLQIGDAKTFLASLPIETLAIA